MPTLEERTQRLEDIEAIRRLKITYARACDANFDADTLGSLFTRDGVWDGGVFGHHEGPEAIAAFYRSMRSERTFGLHYMGGHTIDVAPSGSEATGHWYLWEFGTYWGRAVWLAMTYDDTYRKEHGIWRIASTQLHVHFLTPYESGWAQEPMIQR